MPLNRGTQKQIAQRFKGNLDYFRKPHYWRKLRFFTILFVCLGGSGAMAWFFFGASDRIYNPGAVSRQHAQFAEDCSQCHEPVKKSLAGATLKLSNSGIDQRCEKCHTKHSFHQPNVVHDRSCTACHQEHQGGGSMATPGDSQCLRCHGDAHEMAASAQKGKTISANAFDYRAMDGWKAFKTARPPDGFTAVIKSFGKGHPEFRLIAEKLRETNTLKFNHRRHLVETNDVPLVNGRRIDCTFCHQPGTDGAFMRKFSYEQNCRVCHGLQFDDTAPALTLPHGRAEDVRAFLRSLPSHYAELARAEKTNGASQIDAFVTKQMLHLREQFVDGTNLEREVFFTDLRASLDGRMKFDGCATCHEVTPNGNAAPVITEPSTPDRWMAGARFDHSKHTSVTCVKCHNAPNSADTADVIMPSKATCVECHSPQGRVANNCSFCHKYHQPIPREGFERRKLQSAR